LPAVQKVRDAAARAQCQNNLKQISLAVQNCSDTHQQQMPPGIGNYPGYISGYGPNNVCKNGGCLWQCPKPINTAWGGLLYHLLPYVEQQNLYNATVCFLNGQPVQGFGIEDGGQGGNGPGNGCPGPSSSQCSGYQYIGAPVKLYVCPGDPTGNGGNGYGGWAAIGSYMYNGMLFPQDSAGYSRYPATVTDGVSNTIFFTESYAGNNFTGDQTLYWWDYNSFETPASANGDCGGLNRWGGGFVAKGQPDPYTPMNLPNVNYCTNTTGPWTWGGQVSVCMCRAVSPHAGGINAALGDGSVRLISTGIGPTTWYAACTPNTGDLLGQDW
jgi:prepilin-type processing-associated H-X9-DG protein